MMPVIATFPFQSFPSARLRQPGRGIFLCRVKIQSREERLFNEYFHKYLQSIYQIVKYLTSVFDYPSIAACAAANLAIGTLNGEQLT